ncbi:glycosyltransferase family 4 protein [Kineosporia sp. R_H_3]|uniref:glycosyltransferase family 4 protein n=1 Tax=Kineosporia sp. R_H_3 TaxID=1961848 RepID=UPI000B4B236C|nr:glycosyltransferase family 4 protein [Kineosporia sp. R_H_3]
MTGTATDAATGTAALGRLAAAGGLDVVVPSGVDDPRTPSGGNTYDLRVVEALERLGVPVRRHDVAGGWPRPSADDEQRLTALLGTLPDGGTVLVDGLVGCGAPDPLAAAAARLRLAVVVHLPLGDETGRPPERAATLAARERRAVHAAAVVVATSTATAARVEALHDLPAGTVAVAPPGVDRGPAAEPSAHGGRLLCVASLTPRKGQDVLLAALGTLDPALPWTLDCVGPTGSADHVAGLRRTLAVRGWEQRVRLVGPLTGPALDAAYAAADLLVLPSHAEPYGMVVTEALARGVPVVASDVDGVPEAVGTTPDGGRPGLLVPPGDVPALAAGLRRWLEDPALRTALRARAAVRGAGLPGWDGTARRLAAALVDRRTP